MNMPKHWTETDQAREREAEIISLSKQFNSGVPVDTDAALAVLAHVGQILIGLRSIADKATRAADNVVPIWRDDICHRCLGKGSPVPHWEPDNDGFMRFSHGDCPTCGGSGTRK